MLHILHCLLSGPDLIYISLLIISCIIEYVTNKRTTFQMFYRSDFYSYYIEIIFEWLRSKFLILYAAIDGGSWVHRQRRLVAIKV